MIDPNEYVTVTMRRWNWDEVVGALKSDRLYSKALAAFADRINDQLPQDTDNISFT